MTATLSGQSGGSGPLFFVVKNPVGNTGQGPALNVNWVARVAIWRASRAIATAIWFDCSPPWPPTGGPPPRL